MFGQSKPFGGTTFGAANTSGFGATTGGFGTSTQQQQQQQNPTGMFGTATTSASTTGLFGTTQTAAFGQTNQSSGFGFGANTTQPAGGLFGGTSAAPNTSLFSTPTTSNASFAAKTPAAGVFGQTTQSGAGSLFGNTGANTTTGLFGANTQQTASTGIFGAAANTGFGQQQQPQQAVAAGGTAVKFNPPSGQDTMMKGGVTTQISTRHMCITAMKEYENKSLEELRTEDYTANRKGPQAGSTGLFGATTTTTTQSGFAGFGQQQQKAAPLTGFGTQTATGGLFGGQPQQQQQQQQAGGLFGGATSTKPVFGGTTTTSTATAGSFGGFGGNNQQSSIFGATQQQKPNNPFGQTATSQPAGGLFGAQPNPATSVGFGTTTGFGGGGLFSQPQQQPGAFGTKPTGFGQPTSNTGLAMGTPASGGLFGKTSTATTGLFGQTSTTGFAAPASTSLFGQKPASTFGAPTNTLGTTGGFGTGGFGGGLNLFNNQQNKPGTGLAGFGASTGFGGIGAAANPAGQGLVPGLAPGGAGAGPDQAALQQQLLAISMSPYGDNPLFRSLRTQDDTKKEELLKPTNPSAQKAALSLDPRYKVSTRSAPKLKTRPQHAVGSVRSQLFEGLEDEDSFGNDLFVPRRGWKTLILPKNKTSPSSHGSPPHSRSGSQINGESTLDNSKHITLDLSQNGGGSRLHANGNESRPESEVRGDVSFKVGMPGMNERHGSEDSGPGTPEIRMAGKKLLRGSDSGPEFDTTVSELRPRNMMSAAFEESILTRCDQSVLEPTPDPPANHEPHPAGVMLHRPGYYTIPTLDELAEMVDNDGDCIAEDFVVGRQGYGYVMFPGETNVAQLNLDELVFFRRKEVTIYPEDSTKPDVGIGLNKKAQVTLDLVYPVDKTTREPIKDADRLNQMNFTSTLERASSRMGARFLDYRPETGSWVFEVQHFSKYGLGEEEDGEESTDPQQLQQLKQLREKQLAVQKKSIKAVDSKAGSGNATDGTINGEESAVQQSPVAESVPRHQPLSFPVADDDADSDMADIAQDMPLSQMDEDQMAPSSHRMASSLGIWAPDLQLQKASFFGDDEDEPPPKWKVSLAKSDPSLLQRNVLGSRVTDMGLDEDEEEDRPKQVPTFGRPLRSMGQGSSLLSSSFHRASSTQSILPPAPPQQTSPWKKPAFGVSSHITIPSGMPAQPGIRQVVGTRLNRRPPALKESSFVGRGHSAMDEGLVRAQQFRAGWGPNWSLVHAGCPIMGSPPDDCEPAKPPQISVMSRPTEKRSLDGSPYSLVLEQVDMLARTSEMGQSQVTLEIIEDHLRVQLRHTQVTIEDGCPIAVPCPGNNILSSLTDTASSTLKKLEGMASCEQALYEQCSLVWELCVALWGDLMHISESDAGANSYAVQLARQQAVSEWLSNAVSTQVDKDLEEVKLKGDSGASVLYARMTGHQIEEACIYAQEQGDHRLALMLAQAGTAGTLRNWLAAQLGMWEQSKMDQFIAEERLKLVALMAGVMVWGTSCGRINLCEDMDWKRALAIHLWYQCAPTASVSDAMTQYEGAFNACDACARYAVAPAPAYLESRGLQTVEEGSTNHDVLFQLLKLYCDNSHPLHLLLAPSSITPDHLDFRLGWQLWQVLQALDYHHLSEYHDAMLSSSFAAQLESLGLWHWSIFVLMHVPSHKQREHAIKELLCRHLTLDNSEEEETDAATREAFLRDQLLIPPQWLHYAKAVRAHSEGASEREAWHWLQASQLNRCHKLVLTSLASTAIINGDFGGLKSLLSELGSPEQCCNIEDWDKGGKVFLDYITMMETLEQLKQAKPSLYELEKLQSEVSSLSKRIGGLKCNGSYDRLCQSEMAKKTGNLMRILLEMKSTKDEPHDMLMMETIDLPLPEDYALQELHQLNKNYLLRVATTS